MMLFLGVVCAMLGLHAYPLTCPQLVQDDFQILARGTSWRRTIDNLWIPQNEHAMPLGRLLTFALMQIGGRATLLPWTAGLVGPLAMLAALPLVYLFVRRERGQPIDGLVAAALFGVTSVYQQAVYWFAASFSILTLDTLLLALLAAQQWKQTGRRRYLGLSALASFLAPGWFASGVLAGPLCCLYLLCPRSTAACGLAPTAKPQAAIFTPLLGTALFLAISLPLTAAHIRNLEHYHGRPLSETFNPLVGLGYTARSIVDNLVLGVGGVSTVVTPVPLVVVVLLLLTGAAAWWWYRAPERQLLLLGVGMIGSAYVLVYSARSAWLYEQMTQPNFARYHLLPQLGLALILVGGLPARQALRSPSPPYSGERGWGEGVQTIEVQPPHPRPLSPEYGREGGKVLTPRQGWTLALLIGISFLIQAPRALLGYVVPLPGMERFARNEVELRQLIENRATHEAQRATLQQIAAMEDRCRAHGIDADSARAALPRLLMPGWFSPDANGWELLRGDGPCSLSPEEVRSLLEEPK